MSAIGGKADSSQRLPNKRKTANLPVFGHAAGIDGVTMH